MFKSSKSSSGLVWKIQMWLNEESWQISKQTKQETRLNWTNWTWADNSDLALCESSNQVFMEVFNELQLTPDMPTQETVSTSKHMRQEKKNILDEAGTLTDNKCSQYMYCFHFYSYLKGKLNFSLVSQILKQKLSTNWFKIWPEFSKKLTHFKLIDILTCASLFFCTSTLK